MLDPSYIRDHMEEVRTALRSRGVDADKALEDIATLETARRRLIPELEGLKRQQNTSGDEIARAKRYAKPPRRRAEARVHGAGSFLQLVAAGAAAEVALVFRVAEHRADPKLRR